MKQKEDGNGKIQPKSKSETESNLERLRDWVKKTLPNDWDKVDVKSIVDSTLTYEENKNVLRQHVAVLITDLKSQKEYADAQQERIETEQIQKTEEEVKKYISSLKYESTKELDEYYSKIIRGVKKMCQGYSNLLFVKGKGGAGKSFSIRKSLVQNNADFVEVAGDVTEAYLYRLIFENNGKIIWLKEISKLLAGLKSLNLLKAATETEDAKILTKSSYSKEQEDLPDRFLCKAKFIFDYNTVFGLQLKDDFEALASRGDYIEMAFSSDDIKNIMRLIAKEPWQKEVTEYVIGQFEANAVVKLNLRTQWKAFRTYEYSINNKLEWKKELEGELKNMSRIRAMLYTLIGLNPVRTADLKRLMLRQEVVPTLRTADRLINDYLFLEELFKVSEGEKNFYVCINDLQKSS